MAELIALRKTDTKPRQHRPQPIGVNVFFDGELWWTTVRGHGWTFTNFKDALREADGLAKGYDCNTVVHLRGVA